MRTSLCKWEEIGEVMQFVDQHWKHGHIMSTDRELVDFMHKNPSGGYDIAVAYDDRKQMMGMLGFIPTAHYDSNLSEHNDISLAMWKTIGDIGTGLSMLSLVLEGRNTVGVPGINDKVAKIYKWLGFELVDFQHYYIANRSLTNFRISRFPLIRSDGSGSQDVVGRLRRLTEGDLRTLSIKSYWRPLKTSTYIVNRYLRHPIYKYRVWGVFDRDDVSVLIVFISRKIEVDGAFCERIVDIVGDIQRCGSVSRDWQSVIQQEHSEYVDCLVAGLTEEEMAALGFEKVSGDTVIPNYFEPFLRENVVVKAAFLNRTKSRYVMFKGDGDQDRPSRR